MKLLLQYEDRFRTLIYTFFFFGNTWFSTTYPSIPAIIVPVARRRLDLKRWHNLVEVLQATRDDGRNAKGVNGAQLDYIMTPGNNVSDVHYYLPIPSGEIMLNPELKQNEGW